jgi:hypothetical protein
LENICLAAISKRQLSVPWGKSTLLLVSIFITNKGKRHYY